METGKRVETPQGEGIVVDVECRKLYSEKMRIGVKLDNNPFFYPVAYYWPSEIKVK